MVRMCSFPTDRGPNQYNIDLMTLSEFRKPSGPLYRQDQILTIYQPIDTISQSNQYWSISNDGQRTI